MNLVQSLSPAFTPPHLKDQGDLAVNRERILQTLLLVILSASIIGFIGLIFYTIPRGQFRLLALYTGLTLLIFAFTAHRSMPYIARTQLITLTILAAAITTFIRSGLSGNGELYLLSYIALVTILLGWKTGLIALAVTHTAFVVTGALLVNQVILLPRGLDQLQQNTSEDWVRTAIFMTILSSTVAFSIGMVLRGLQRSLDRSHQLAHDLRSEQASLQARVEQRTQVIQTRMNQILTASEVSRSIVSLRNDDRLLFNIVELVRSRFDLYYVGIFIVDDGNNAVLRAGSGEAGRRMLAARHMLPLKGSSMIGWSVTHHQTRVALDVGAESIRFVNPYLPDTRSELAIPILSQGEGIGAISIQSNQTQAFDADDIAIFEGIANSLAIALENANLYRQAKSALDEVRALNQEYLSRAWTEQINLSGALRYSFENTNAENLPGEHILEIPLSVRNETIGKVTLETGLTTLTSDQQIFVDAITTQTALALENARLIHETQRRITQEQVLNDLTADFSLANDIEAIIKSALRQLNSIPAVSEAAIHVAPSTVNAQPAPETQPALNTSTPMQGNRDFLWPEPSQAVPANGNGHHRAFSGQEPS